MSSDIKVSVCVVTYNQEKYIAECLQSLVDQVTDFRFEIIVGEDCSTDKTREIVEVFANKYPELIVRNYQAQNVGSTRNTISTYMLARGKYIAHIDGDDFAFKDKLRLQCDVLDRYSSCYMSTHRSVKVDLYGKKLGVVGASASGIKNYDFLIENLPFFPHSSKMFRNQNIADIAKELNDDIFDFELHVFQMRYGAICHLMDVLGGYRANVGVAVGGGALNKKMVAAKYAMLEREMTQQPCKRHTLRIAYRKSALNYAKASFMMKDFEGFRSNLVHFAKYENSSLDFIVVPILRRLPEWILYIALITFKAFR